MKSDRETAWPPLLFFVGKGAAHVDLVEHQPPAVNAKQQQVLAALKQRGFPVSRRCDCWRHQPGVEILNW